jgi:N-methylhydantoinase B
MGLVLASNGKAVAQNTGLAGGHPGNSGLDVVARQSRITEILASGRMPSSLEEVSDSLEPGQNYASSYLAPGEVFAMTWQGGGGYGDPLTRDPEAVARDVREEKITEAAAKSVYGVVLGDGSVDTAATRTERSRLRNARRDRSRITGETRGKVDLASTKRIDDNLVEVGSDVACGHCGEVLGDTADGPLALAVYDGAPTDAGPQIIATAADYVDAPVVFRQYCCPSCWTALSSAVVPADHPDAATTLGRLTVTAG